jgi:hypothetical protein
MGMSAGLERGRSWVCPLSREVEETQESCGLYDRD